MLSIKTILFFAISLSSNFCYSSHRDPLFDPKARWLPFQISKILMNYSTKSPDDELTPRVSLGCGDEIDHMFIYFYDEKIDINHESSIRSEINKIPFIKINSDIYPLQIDFFYKTSQRQTGEYKKCSIDDYIEEIKLFRRKYGP